MARNNRVFGLSAYSLVGEIADDLPAGSDFTKIEDGSEEPIARLLQASYGATDGDLRHGSLEGYYREAADRLLEHEPEVSGALRRPGIKLRWVRENPIFLVVVIPARVALAVGLTSFSATVGLALYPFIEGFANETGRMVARRMWMDLVSSRGQ